MEYLRDELKRFDALREADTGKDIVVEDALDALQEEMKLISFQNELFRLKERGHS